MVEGPPRSYAYLWGYRGAYLGVHRPNPYAPGSWDHREFEDGRKAGENDELCNEIRLTRAST